MKKQNIAKLIFAIPLLVSCSKNIPLRSDIEDFIASFSLSESMQVYREVFYSAVKEQLLKNEHRFIYTNLNFNVKNIEDGEIEYHKSVKVYKDDVLETETDIKIETENGKYYNVINDSKQEVTIDDCLDTIEQFFFEETMTDYYHYNGNYYGDLVLETCRQYQEFVTIDQEKQLYVLAYNREGYEDVETDNGKVNKYYKVQQEYSVNKLGMLVENHLDYRFGDEFIKEDILVSKI